MKEYEVRFEAIEYIHAENEDEAMRVAETYISYSSRIFGFYVSGIEETSKVED